MAPKPKFSIEQAEQIKAMIWDGASNEDVAKCFGISVPSIVNIKSGRQYHDAKWPSGTTGPMPAMQHTANSNNKRFVTEFENYQYVPEAERLYRSSSSAVKINLDNIARSHTCEDCGKSDFANWIELSYHTVKHEDEKREKERYERLRAHDLIQAEFERKYPNGKPYDGPPRSDPNGPFEPPAESMKPWDEILFISNGKVAIVDKAESEDNQNLKDAISHIFFELTPGQWNEPSIAAACLKLEARIAMARSTEIIQIE